jgi:hypothetical protein
MTAPPSPAVPRVPLRPDQEIIEALNGFVVGDPPAESPIKEELRKILPRPPVPSRIRTIKKIPLSQNGRIDRKALARLAEGRCQNHVSFRLPTGMGVRDHWNTHRAITKAVIPAMVSKIF